MTELSMNQVIHAAVRRDVARTGQALRAFPDGDAARARELQRAWANLVHELTHHHEAEDEHAWPFLREHGIEAALLDEMESEHQAMKEALAAMTSAFVSLVESPTAAQAESATAELDRAAPVLIGHLDHEERDLEPVMDRLVDDPGWRAQVKKMRPASLGDGANALAWMQDGATETERASLRAHVPAPVVAVMTGLVARRYRKEIAPVWRS